jgi:hypothetical protein
LFGVCAFNETITMREKWQFVSAIKLAVKQSGKCVAGGYRYSFFLIGSVGGGSECSGRVCCSLLWWDDDDVGIGYLRTIPSSALLEFGHWWEQEMSRVKDVSEFPTSSCQMSRLWEIIMRKEKRSISNRTLHITKELI